MINRHAQLISLAICLLLVSSVFPPARAARKITAVNPTRVDDRASAKVQRRTALVVGNNKYPKAPLKNPCNDAEDIKAILKEFEFDVESCLDTSLKGTTEAIDRFITNLKPDSVGLFYYAGHGMQIAGENYLIPVDFVDKDEQTAKHTSYSISLLNDRMTDANKGLNIIILDACRNNPFRIRSGRPIPERGLAAMFVNTGSFIAFATAPNQVADDNPNERNGRFTKHLLRGLKESPSCLNEVFDRTRARVVEETKGKQVPFVTTSVVGRFCFKDPPAVDPKPPVQPDNISSVRKPEGTQKDCKGIAPSNTGTFPIEGKYEPSGIMGDIDDVRIMKSVDFTRFRYTTTGKGRHEWDYKYDRNELSNRPAQFGGVMYLSPPNNFGNVCGGFDLSSVRRVIKWEARSSVGEAKVEFIIGGVTWAWDEDSKKKSTPPFPDSMPRTTLGIKKLTQQWQTFEFNLSDLPESYFTRVVNGFTWVISWGSNDVNLNDDGTVPEKQKTFEIEIRNIRYER